jgi:hypothetical protein
MHVSATCALLVSSGVPLRAAVAADPLQTEPVAISVVAAVTAPDPARLGALILERFATGTPDAFNQVYSHPEGRQFVASATAGRRRRVPGHARVLSRRGDRAVLLLTGHVEYESPGTETLVARAFSGLYEARRGLEGWSLARHLPIDADSRIRRQDVRVEVRPGSGMHVVTRMAMRVDRAEGVAVRLNRGAVLRSVRVDGRPVDHLFSGGLLWARSSARGETIVELDYAIAPGPATSSTLAIGPEHGFVRDQEIWLPVLNYRTEADMAHISVEARVPAAHQMSVSVPQTETVHGGVRRVTGTTLLPAHGISIGYDTAWSPYDVAVGDARLRAFVGPEFTPSRTEVEAAFRWSYDQLTGRFGPPRAQYFAVSQRRSARWASWTLLTNNTIVGGTGGGPVWPQIGQYIGAGFGHEISHAWTTPTGPGRFLLMEGWATFAESYLVAAAHGAAAERAFWESYRNHYGRNGFEGSVGILTDYNNRGVAYSKGAWTLRMLRDRLGEATFLRGLRTYMDTEAGQPAGVPEFTAAMSRAAGFDVWPLLRPWIEEDVTPDLTGTVVGNRLRIVQAGPIFDLPVTVELTTSSGVVRRQVMIDAREEEFDISGAGQVTAVRLDPDRQLLMRRTLGETVVFQLQAPSTTRHVQLGGDFTQTPVDALFQNGTWRVTVPLTEGFYHWWWLVDGRRAATLPSGAPLAGTREVRALHALAAF